MRKQFVTSGLAVASALVLLGAGCSPVEPADNPTPVPDVPPVYQGSNTDPYEADDQNQGDEPVTGYEKDLSSPAQ